jgi:hypothetical protein
MNRIILMLLVLAICNTTLSLFAQSGSVTDFQIIMQSTVLSDPMDTENDSIWLEGQNVYYQCLISKANAEIIDGLSLVVTYENDTIFNNNYMNPDNYINSSEDEYSLIKDYGTSVVLEVDTLLYNTDYIFILKVLNSEGIVIQELIFDENE